MAVINNNSSVFQRIPNELANRIFDFLPNHDIKNLRLTCRYLNCHAPLRFNRVFVSANPLNVKVFLAIANHDTFRQQVKELIWDDATLQSARSSGNDSDDDYSSDESETDDNDYQGHSRFQQHCREAIEDVESRLVDKPNGNEHQTLLGNAMPLCEALPYYERLVKAQASVIESEADERAVQYALQESRFPNLTRVTVTPAAHGFLFFPLYETPMIRAFPHGFVYPIPRGWTSAFMYAPGRAEA